MRNADLCDIAKKNHNECCGENKTYAIGLLPNGFTVIKKLCGICSWSTILVATKLVGNDIPDGWPSSARRKRGVMEKDFWAASVGRDKAETSFVLPFTNPTLIAHMIV
jgi:hypothetical protein